MHLLCALLQAGLEPTHQVVRLARDAGFDNVHDYLVHLVTGMQSRRWHAGCVRIRAAPPCLAVRAASLHMRLLCHMCWWPLQLQLC